MASKYSGPKRNSKSNQKPEKNKSKGPKSRSFNGQKKRPAAGDRREGSEFTKSKPASERPRFKSEKPVPRSRDDARSEGYSKSRPQSSRPDAFKRNDSKTKISPRPRTQSHGKPQSRSMKEPSRDFSMRKDSPQADDRKTFLSKRDLSRQSFVLYGRHPVEQMLSRLSSREDESRDEVKAYFLSAPDSLPPSLVRIQEAARELGAKLIYTEDIESFPAKEDVNHQRVALVMKSYPTVEWDDFNSEFLSAQDQEWGSKRGCVGVVCDQIQDPHNLGAILRSAAFFGCSFVILGKDRQAPLSGAALRSAAGGDASLEIVQVTNIARCLEELKEHGLWIVGTDCATGASAPQDIPSDRPYILVLGNEQKGIRKEVLKNCDFRMNIPGGTKGLDSLNVSVASGVALFALTSTLPSAREAE